MVFDPWDSGTSCT